MRRKITHPIDFQPDVPPGGGQQSPQNGGRGTRLSRRDQVYSRLLPRLYSNYDYERALTLFSRKSREKKKKKKKEEETDHTPPVA